MSSSSDIEWTDATWNPVVGCTAVSPGCLNCYAATFSARGMHENYVGMTVRKNGRAVFNGTVRTLGDKLAIPLNWRKPRRIFVNSMSDLFHEAVPFDFIAAVFGVAAACPRHTFQILTKRPERAAEFFDFIKGKRGRIAFQCDSPAAACCDALHHHGRMMYSTDFFPETEEWPLPNVWIGTSVENQKAADERIPHLLRCPAGVRFLSCEPLLGPVNLRVNAGSIEYVGEPAKPLVYNTLEEFRGHPGLHWVIVGGESGPGARPMHPDWARSLRDQCSAAGVPYFFKQWGAWEPVTPLYDGRDDSAENGRGDLEMLDTRGRIWTEHDGQPNDMRTWLMERVGKKDAGRILDGRTWDDFPRSPALAEGGTL